MMDAHKSYDAQGHKVESPQLYWRTLRPSVHPKKPISPGDWVAPYGPVRGLIYGHRQSCLVRHRILTRVPGRSVPSRTDRDGRCRRDAWRTGGERDPRLPAPSSVPTEPFPLEPGGHTLRVDVLRGREGRGERRKGPTEARSKNPSRGGGAGGRHNEDGEVRRPCVPTQARRLITIQTDRAPGRGVPGRKHRCSWSGRRRLWGTRAGRRPSKSLHTVDV